MTVKEFKKLITELPSHTDNWEVVMSTDAEGNGFNLFNSNGISFDETPDCTQYFDGPSSELCQYNDFDYDSYDDFIEHIENHPHVKPCIVLWP